jgi:hypothetical protein
LFFKTAKTETTGVVMGTFVKYPGVEMGSMIGRWHATDKREVEGQGGGGGVGGGQGRIMPAFHYFPFS